MQKDFLERVVETRENVEGVRSPTDHLRRLVKDVVALREDGVSWQWIADKFNEGRGPQHALPVTTVRTLWTRVDKPPEPGETQHPEAPGTTEGVRLDKDADWLETLFEREKSRERRQGRG